MICHEQLIVSGCWGYEFKYVLFVSLCSTSIYHIINLASSEKFITNGHLRHECHTEGLTSLRNRCNAALPGRARPSLNQLVLLFWSSTLLWPSLKETLEVCHYVLYIFQIESWYVARQDISGSELVCPLSAGPDSHCTVIQNHCPLVLSPSVCI